MSEDFAAVSAHVERMFDEPGVNWWRFVPCPTCAAWRGDGCVMGGESWPKPTRPHASRQRYAQVLHGTLWLLANGFEGDVLARRESEESHA